MNRSIRILLALLLLPSILFSQVKIIGIAPQFVGKKISLYSIDDFINNHETKLQTASIDAKGIFKFSLELNTISKCVLRVLDFESSIYLQPKTYYQIDIDSEDSTQNRAYYREIELVFYDLDSTDINYKILGFQTWIDNEIADNFVNQNVNIGLYVKNMTQLKQDCINLYRRDSLTYFKDFVKYSIATDIDQFNYIGGLSEEDKFRIYLDKQPILYDHDQYMKFMMRFYDRYWFKLTTETSSKMFSALASDNIKKCDSLLALQPFMSNPEIRSLVLIYILKQNNLGNYLPQSLVFRALKQIMLISPYPNQVLMCKHILEPIDVVSVGSDFISLSIPKENPSIKVDAKLKKYIYLHAFDPENSISTGELNALKKLQKTYGSDIEFISLYVDKEEQSTSMLKSLSQITWAKAGLKKEDPLWHKLGIFTYPYYILINKDFEVVASPALTPSPNGKYETIEKTMYQIKNP